MFEQKIINTIKYLIYALIIVVPLVYFPTMMMPFQLSKTIVFQILAEIIFVLWLGLAIFNNKYRVRISPLIIFLSVFMAIMSISVIFGPDWRMSLWSDESRSLGLVALWHFFILFLAISSLKEKINWNIIWTLSFLTAAVVSLIGISQKFFIFPKGANPWLYILYPGIPERVGSTFSNPAFMAGYLLFNFFIGLWLFGLLAQNKNLKIKSLIGLGIILITIAIFLSQTLGVLLGLAIGILIFIFWLIFQSHSKVLYKTSLATLGILIILSGIFLFTRENSFWQKIPGLKRIADFSLQRESISGRLITWRLSLNAFKEKPIFGWGLENFRIPFDKYYNPQLLNKNMFGTYWDKPHNVILEYLVTTGIVGLLAYLGIFVSVFYTLLKKQLNYKIFFLSAIIAYFIQNFFVFDTIGTYLMFFLILAFIDSYSTDKLLNFSSNSTTDNLITQKIIAGVLLLTALIPIYYNFQTFKGANYEYWGVNYFLNRLPESSLLSFNKALMTSTPYIDDVRKNFANTVKQAHQQGINYPDLEDLQSKLIDHLRLTIQRHPKGFLNYLALAEFENIFYKFNQDYLRESEELAIKVLELSPKRQQAFYVLGKARLLKGDTLGAYKAFEEAVSVSFNSAEPHFYFALIVYNLGDAKKGAMELAEAERLGRGPQKIEEFVVLGNYIGDLNQNYKKAISYYISALDLLDRKVMNSSIGRGDILLKLAIAYYFDHNFIESKKTFLELKKMTDLKTLPIYEDLKPVLQEIGIN